MQFTYRLTPADCATAARIKFLQKQTRTIQDLVALLIMCGTWLVVFTGMLLERFFILRSRGIHPRTIPGTDHVLLWSLIPGFFLGWLSMIAVLVAVNVLKKRQLAEQLRANPALHADTTATFTPEYVSFESATGSSRAIWDLFEAWTEQNDVVILAMRNGTRAPVKISSLDQSQRNELHSILAAALPKR
jgi:hypothetical protein